MTNHLRKVSILLLIPTRAGLFSCDPGDPATCPKWDNQQSGDTEKYARKTGINLDSPKPTGRLGHLPTK